MKKHHGFTMMELMIVMFIISILVVPLMNVLLTNIEERRLNTTIAEISDLFQSAQTFAADNVGAWPDEATGCANAVSTLQLPAQGYLVGFNTTSVFGAVYSTACPVLGLAPRRFNVSVDVGDVEVARKITGVLPATTMVGSVITTSVPLPAQIPALELLLPRDGTRPMTGDLAMGNNKMTGLFKVASADSSCASGVVQGDLGIGPLGQVLTCQSGFWRDQQSLYWREPVDYFSSLPTCNSSKEGRTHLVRNGSDGAGRPRAYACSIGTWKPLSVDDNGDLAVPNNVKVGSTNLGAPLSRSATGKLGVGTIEIKKRVTLKSACSVIGTVASDLDGTLVSCQSPTYTWLPAVQLTLIPIGTPRVIAGRNVNYAGGGLWLDAVDNGARNRNASWNICKGRGSGWTLPTSTDLARASQGAANRTGSFLWSSDWSAYAEFRGRYHSGWAVRLTDSARVVVSRGANLRYRCMIAG